MSTPSKSTAKAKAKTPEPKEPLEEPGAEKSEEIAAAQAAEDQNVAEQEAAEAAQAAAVEGTSDDEVAVEALVANAFAYMGHSNAAAAAALSEHDVKSLTPSDAKSIVDEWLSRPVNQED